MQIRQHGAYHLGRGLAQAIAFGLISMQVRSQPFIDAGFFVELSHQGGKVEHFKSATWKIVDPIRNVEQRRRSEYISQRYIARSFIGGRRGRREFGVLDVCFHPLAQIGVQIRLIFSHQSAKRRRLFAWRRIESRSVERRHHDD